MRSEEPTSDLIARMRAWDPVLDELVAMPITSPAIAVAMVWFGARFEHALKHHQWIEAEQVMEEVRAFLAQYSGGSP